MKRHLAFAASTLARAVWLFLAALPLLGSSCPKLAGTRLVAAYRAENDALSVRMSMDSQLWTQGEAVQSDGTAMVTRTAPTILREGDLYHLYWIDAADQVRYAVSSDAHSWTVQSSPLTRIPATLNPSFVRGAGKQFAFYRGGQGEVVRMDLDNPVSPVPIGGSGRDQVSSTFGNGLFAVAGIDNNRQPIVLASTDGTHFAPKTAPAVANAEQVVITFMEGQFTLVTKRIVSTGGDIPVTWCNVFTSSDATSWTEQQFPNCGNVGTELAALRYNGQNVLLDSIDSRGLSVSVAGGDLLDTHFQGQALGRVSYTSGPGPRLAAFRLNRVTLAQGSGDDMTIVSIGFRVRIGEPGSARATLTGTAVSAPQLIRFSVQPGGAVDIPPAVSPPAWLVEPPVDPNSADGRIDVIGGIEIGIKRGGCPEGSILGQLGQARAAVESSMNRNLATAHTADLLDDTRRAAIVQRIQCEVNVSLSGGNPSDCAPAQPTPGPAITIGQLFPALFSGFGQWVGGGLRDFFVSAACGFRRDEELQPTTIQFVYFGLVPEGNPPRTSYRLSDTDPSPRTLDPFTLRNADGSSQWSVSSTLTFLGIP